jgi:hypothetical protein
MNEGMMLKEKGRSFEVGIQTPTQNLGSVEVGVLNPYSPSAYIRGYLRLIIHSTKNYNAQVKSSDF